MQAEQTGSCSVAGCPQRMAFSLLPRKIMCDRTVGTEDANAVRTDGITKSHVPSLRRSGIIEW